MVQHGLERINEAGVEFDPNIHEALLRQAVPEIPADHVGQVLRNGYRKGTTVLRAAGIGRNRRIATNNTIETAHCRDFVSGQFRIGIERMGP